MNWLILPHPQAPNLTTPDSGVILDQLVNEMTSENFAPNEETRVLFRQAGYVNLWFFLKFIAGYNGPFNKLNTDLHWDMCNTRMRFQRKGARFAAFEPRKVYKSTVFTEGAVTWSMLRNPEKSHAIFSATTSLSIDFMHVIQRIFDSNEFFAWLYPEYVPKKNQRRWNDEEACLPNRTRHSADPNLAAYGVGCTTAGKHPDDMYIDDPVGDQQLNAMRQSSAEMYKIANWVKSNIRTLAKDLNASIYYCGTRYAVDDAHAFIFESVKEKLGYWDELDEGTYKYRPQDGEWSVYYRMVEEHGEIIMPEAYTREMLNRMKEEDPWTYWTQAQNHPQKSGLAELNNYIVPECLLGWDEMKGFVVRLYVGADVYEDVELKDCDVIQAGDPAGTDRYLSAKTSRSAVVVMAHDCKDRRFLLKINVGYIKTSEFFEWFFSNMKRFNNVMRATYLETQGGFKILGPLLKEKEAQKNAEAIAKRDKQVFLKLKPATKTGDKDVTIRNVYEPLLNAGLLYVERSCREEFLAELNVFPQGSKKDILDAGALALQHTTRPLSRSELEYREAKDFEFANRDVGFAGM